jgi:hypothetical protein
MNAITLFAMIGAFLTVLTLFSGISSMAHGGDDDKRRSHLLMFKRVGWQALTVLFIFMAMLSQMRA